MRPTKTTVISDKAYASLKGLLQCRLLANQLNLSQKYKNFSLQSGPISSKFKGRGVGFSEVRAYQAGDDVRSIDWRVTARTRKTHTKLYIEERERPAIIIADQSQSMFFGSQICFKSVLCAYTATLLAWSILARGDRIGGIVFADAEHMNIRPRRSHHTALKFIETLLLFNKKLNANNNNQQQSFNLSKSLEQARRIIKPGSEIFIVSDFNQFDETAEKHLFQLAKHNDIVSIMIYDHLEEELPPPGNYAISDGNNTYHAELYNQTLQHTWHKLFQAKQDKLHSYFNRLKIPFIKIRTDQNLLSCIQSGLGITTPNRK